MCIFCLAAKDNNACDEKIQSPNGYIQLFLTHCVMENLPPLSSETKILLPVFRCWTQKDVDYRVSVFQTSTNLSVNVLPSSKVNYNSVSSRLTRRPKLPTLLPECLSSFGKLPLYRLYRVHVCPQLVSHAHQHKV